MPRRAEHAASTFAAPWPHSGLVRAIRLSVRRCRRNQSGFVSAGTDLISAECFCPAAHQVVGEANLCPKPLAFAYPDWASLFTFTACTALISANRTFTVLKCTLCHHTFTILNQKPSTFTVPPPYGVLAPARSELQLEPRLRRSPAV